MKKLMTVVFTMLVASCMAFGQAGGGSTDKNATQTPPPKAESGKKASKKGKAHKGGKKGKKGAGDSGTTPPPK